MPIRCRSPSDTLLQMVMQDSTGAAAAARSLTSPCGQYDQPTVSKITAPPSAILPFDTTALPRNRLGLAEWLFEPNNPLTARVAVNHLWQEIFGRGIVATPTNFGSTGRPAHAPRTARLAGCRIS